MEALKADGLIPEFRKTLEGYLEVSTPGFTCVLPLYPSWPSIWFAVLEESNLLTSVKEV